MTNKKIKKINLSIFEIIFLCTRNNEKDKGNMLKTDKMIKWVQI